MTEEKSKRHHRTERVKLFIANFHQEFMKGLTMREIEEKYHLSKGYGYQFLDEIARNNDVSKETYFQKEHGPHICISRDGRLVLNKNISFDEIRSNLNTASSALDQAANHLDEIAQVLEHELNL